MFVLNNIKDNDGARRPKKRVGRGMGSGMGKTSRRGHNGQKSRSGVSLNGFEGGQNPIYRRLPKRGFTNIFRKDLMEIDFNKVNAIVEKGLLKDGETLDLAFMVNNGLAKKRHDGLALVNNGALAHKVTLSVYRASKPAQEAATKAGATVTIEKK